MSGNQINVSDKDCISAYEKTQNLKLAGKLLGLKWQTLYVRLKKNGVNVVGNKSKYGSISDKIGAKGEALFKSLVPFADDQNEIKFQAKVDFVVNGALVDVKSAYPRITNKNCKNSVWGFSLKRQESVADFFVMFGFDKNRESPRVFLIPGDMCRYYQSISISIEGTSKWKDFEVDINDLSEFFKSLD